MIGEQNDLLHQTRSLSVNFSKPHMQRALIIALLCNERISIANPSWSTETQALLAACENLGMKVIENLDNLLVVKGVGTSIVSPDQPVSVRGSGALLRFLISLAFFVPGLKMTLVGNLSLKGRPMDCFLEELGRQGLKYEFKHTDSEFCLCLENCVSHYQPIQVRADMTSQFVTALLLCAPINQQDTVIELAPGKTVSEAYIDLTINMMRSAGVSVHSLQHGYRVQPATYSISDFQIPSDFTSASYLVGLSLTSRTPITLENYHPSEFTAEKLFFDTARKMGLGIYYDQRNKSLSILPLDNAVASQIIIDASDIPTVVPTLTAMAPFFNGTLVLYNASHVENHKTRRISVITKELEKTGIRYRILYTDDGRVDGFVTDGQQAPVNLTTADPHGDHRNFMSLFIALVTSPAGTIVKGAELVHASFPNFMDQVGKLGINLSFVE